MSNMLNRFNKKALIVVAVSLAMLMLLSGCTSLLIGSGTITSEERTVSEFDSIVFNGAGEVTVSFADRYSVNVTTDSSAQQHVKTTVTGGALNIGSALNISMDLPAARTTKLAIDITMPTLTAIDMEGAGSITLNEGSAESLTIKLAGVGSVDATRYQVKHATVNLGGVGTLKVWATDSLDGNLSGVGQLVYKGNPTLNVQHDGVGSIVRQ
ncbi:hypothetical protein AGMMS49992_05680 [Clostridia bacterium]|nr:hypothetical protein AGMMS49992_05680 [Clostridia bacterium]